MTSIDIVGVDAVRRGPCEVAVPDLRLDRPGLVRVQGGNGAGKSTLVELIAGGLRPPRGTVRVAGLPAHRAHRHRRVCRAEIGLLPGLSARTHARLFARAAGVTTAAAVAALGAAGLASRLDVEAGALSTGEQRRVWVALTTLGSSSVLLLDEPFLGLDADAARDLCARIEDWCRDRLVLLVDHAARPWQGAPLLDVRLEARPETST